jgi:hypothetical protein
MSYAARQEIDALQEALSAWFARRVDRSVRRSTDQTWFAEHTRPRYPAGRDLELIPSPGRVTFHGPGGQWWHDPLLDRVVCMTWAPRGALAAGLLAGPGDKDLRLWFAAQG